MKYRNLGEEGPHRLRVSEACLGTMTWGEQNTEAEAFEQLDYALAHGVNFIDTAELYPVPPNAQTYGETERIIGRWLAADPSRREQVVLATKVTSFGRDYIPTLRGVDLNGAPDEEQPARLTAAQMARALDASLARLQTDYVDLYQLHWPERYTNIFAQRDYKRAFERASTSVDDQVLGVKALLDSGKVRAWGLSNENAVGVGLFLAACARDGVPPPATIQNDFSLLHRKFEEDGTAEAGKYVKRGDGTRAAPADSRHVAFPFFQPRYVSGASLDAADAYAALAAKRGVTPSQLAIQWARSREYMGSVIIGATKMAQLAEDIAAFELADLEPAELLEMDAVSDHDSPYYRGVGAVAVVADDAACGEEDECAAAVQGIAKVFTRRRG
ncbi:oxidoreductase [Aureococcus anophagefferens]|nr:oxidoreductase [Aureococcus anophagefferens]